MKIRAPFVADVKAIGAASPGHEPVARDVGPDDGSWLPVIQDLTVPPSRLGPTASISPVVAIVGALTAVVALGLIGPHAGAGGPGLGAGSSMAARSSVDTASTVDHTAPPALPARRGVEIVILLPASGDVILAGSVAVAGTVAIPGAPRGLALPDFVRVTIRDDRVALGEATLPVVDGRFVGWIPVSLRDGAVTVEIRVRTLSLAVPAVSSHEVVLRAGSPDGRQPTPQDGDQR